MGRQITSPAEIILIGFWHAFQRGITKPLPENSMDVDPITDSEEVARICYEALIGSEFEKVHGWHVNLMPDLVLREFPSDWKARAISKGYGPLTVVVPSPEDLMIPKRKRGEPRDRAHEVWAKSVRFQSRAHFRITPQQTAIRTNNWMPNYGNRV